MSTSTLVSQGGSGGSTMRTNAEIFRNTATDAQIERMTNEQLVKSSEQLQTTISWLQLETDVFTKFLRRVDPWEHGPAAAGDSRQPGSSVPGSVLSTTPSLSPAQSTSDMSSSDQSTRSTVRASGRLKRSGKGRSGQRTSGLRGVAVIRLTPEQRCDVASRELEELNEQLLAQENQHERSLQNLRAVLDSADIRLKEIQMIRMSFEKDVVKGASSVRATRVPSEKVQRHYDELNKTRDALLEKLRLKNANMKSKTRKLEAHMRQKEEMGEVLRQVDFDQLKIENQQFLDRIEEKNNTMIQLKLLAGRSLHELNQQKRKLQTLTEEGQRLDAATQKELSIGKRVATERAVVEKQLQQSRITAEKLRQQTGNYRVPPTIDYVKCNDRVYQLKRKNIIWKRKLDISKMTLLNVRAVHGIRAGQPGAPDTVTPYCGISESTLETGESRRDGAAERPEGRASSGGRCSARERTPPETERTSPGSALSVVSSKMSVGSKCSLNK